MGMRCCVFWVMISQAISLHNAHAQGIFSGYCNVQYGRFGRFARLFNRQKRQYGNFDEWVLILIQAFSVVMFMHKCILFIITITKIMIIMSK